MEFLEFEMMFDEQEQYLPIEFANQEQYLPIEFIKQEQEEEIFGDIGYTMLKIPIATEERLGGVIIGSRLAVEPDGRVSVTGGADVDIDELTNKELEAILST